MAPLPDLLTLFFLLLAVASAAALGLSLLALAFRRRRRGADAFEAQGPRHWSGDEYAERLRRIYFQKERRARAIREQERLTREAEERGRRERDEPLGAPGDGQASPPPEAPAEWRYRAVLELEGDPTPERIRLAYKRMIAAYHPDKVAGLGVKLQELAEEETKVINEAYAFFRERYGF